MKKYLLIVVLALFVLGAGALAAVWLYFGGQSLPTTIQEARCTVPITVQGQMMQPAIPSGTRLLLDKCSDKQNIPTGTIVLFSEGGITMVGRVKERTGSDGAVSYKIGQDGRPQNEFTVPANGITATGETQSSQ